MGLRDPSDTGGHGVPTIPTYDVAGHLRGALRALDHPDNAGKVHPVIRRHLRDVIEEWIPHVPST